jgi:gluconokinase
MVNSLVIMGVAGCGKSTLAQAVARAEQARLVEGDQFHSPQSLANMQRGIALTDDDRASWLQVLATQLATSHDDVVMTCSALRRSYRDQLRAASPGLRFVYMAIGRDAAQARVLARAREHFFSASLVGSQFATLEPPVGEARVLVVDALAPIDQLQADVSAWLREVAHP